MGDSYLSLNGASGAYASTPDSAALSIAGDIDIRCHLRMTDWTPAGVSALVLKTTSGGVTSYGLYVNTDGTLRFIWATDGNYSANRDKASSVSTGIADGTDKWVRATLDVDNGSNQCVTRFYLSDDGESWTQLGSDAVQSGATFIFDANLALAIGADAIGTSQRVTGRIYRAQVRNGIDGTIAFDAEFHKQASGVTGFTESSANAATVTVNGAASIVDPTPGEVSPIPALQAIGLF